MKTTEQEMRGLLAGKCLPGDIRLNEELPAYLVRKFDELQQKLDAMAAENDLARKAVQTFCDVVGSNTDAICEEVGAEGVKAILAAMSATGNMPATDAYLNSARAEALREVINSGEFSNWVNQGLQGWINRFLSGTHDTADKEAK
ncbi:hypothetical protein [Pantoea allii]|uniref:hypothetical protein n=1 Tax=Pantoea allii TaxID=574096 RepID=UPI0024B74C9A|nr:hypothetical protein [Pantoea allii]MDJ0087665.1 hypothetical protein [Pantoea allii]